MRYISIVVLLMLTSCDVTKSLFKSKSKTQTSESNEVTSTTSRQITEDWSQIGSTLQHRNGLLAIQFDGAALIDIRPDGSVQFSGDSPSVISSTSFTDKDTTVTTYSSTENSKKDSTAFSIKDSLERSVENSLELERETQKVWPILLFVLLIIVALILLFRPKTFRL